jgi:hypothetical protein
MLTPLLAAALALRDAPASPVPAPAPPPAEAITLDDLPMDQAAATRCAIAYATLARWQQAGDARGSGFAAGAGSSGREFFVRVMAKLMDDARLTRAHVEALTARGFAENDTPEGAARLKAMLPACDLMKSAAGL